MKSVELGEIFDITSSKRVFQSEWTVEGVPFYRAREIVKISKNGFVDNNLYISEEMYERYKSKYGVPNEGDILITGVGTLGITYRVKKGDKFYFKDGNIIWFRKKSDVDSKFVQYCFQSQEVLRQIKGGANGATVGTYTIEKAKKTKIPLPSLATQKKIAAILDAADAHRQKTKQLLAKYDELAKSIFLEMFGDPVTNPKGWEKVKLGSITNMKAGKFVSASEISSERDEDMYECYGGNGLRGYVKSHTHKGDFVLIGRQGALCGNVKIASGIFHATEHAIVCSPKKGYETLWLYFLLNLLNLNKFATGAAQPGLNVGKLIEVEIVLPPKNLQVQFVERFNLIELQKVLSQKELDQSEGLFNSLLQKAFKGELVK